MEMSKLAIKSNASVARVKALHVSTTQGYAGLLARDSQHVFSYAPDVVVDAVGARSISLTMPIRAASYQASLMLPVFQTFLPEGFLADRIVEKFSKTMRVDDMALLALTSTNAIGRIRVSQLPSIAADKGNIESLKEILGDTGSKDLFEYLCDRYLIASGISGVQPKVMIDASDDLIAPKKTKTTIGEKSTLRAKRLIVKVSGSEYPHLTENEFHCLSIAQKIGVPVPRFWLSEDKKRLAVERFDIDATTNEFLGFEDMVSLQGKVNERKYEGSYENVALAIRQNASPTHVQQSLNEFYASLVLSMVMKNGDAHLKNFGLLYTDPETDDCRLSPTYDVVCTTAFLPKDLPALSLARTKAWPTRAALIKFGREHCRVQECGAVIDATITAAMEYRPDNDESGMWATMKKEVDMAANWLSRDR
jgi:serine/threonine-protein kinase HipA